ASAGKTKALHCAIYWKDIPASPDWVLALQDHRAQSPPAPGIAHHAGSTNKKESEAGGFGNDRGVVGGEGQLKPTAYGTEVWADWCLIIETIQDILVISWSNKRTR